MNEKVKKVATRWKIVKTSNPEQSNLHYWGPEGDDLHVISLYVTCLASGRSTKSEGEIDLGLAKKE